jgi:Uma2 family endonuclease
MITATVLSVEEYLRYSGKPNCEYRDGFLHPKPIPTTLHGLLEFLLVAMLNKLGLQAAPEVTVKLSPAKFLVPDVIADLELESPYPTAPVLLCCEILSPDDRLATTFAKCEEYHAWGVPFCWVLDPVERTAWEHHQDGKPTRASGSLHAGEYSVNLEQLFAGLGSS